MPALRQMATNLQPAIPGRPSGFVAYNFQAVTIDGDILDKKDVISFLNLPLDRVCRVQVMTDSPQIPTIRLGCDPTKDDTHAPIAVFPAKPLPLTE